MSDFSTPLSRRLGLRYPIVIAPMFLISNKEMIVAAAKAGVLGTMPSLNARTPEKFEEDLKWIRERTDGAFGINMTIGLTKPERLAADIELCERYKVPVWITSYGNPTEAVGRAKASGAIVFHDVINLRHAKKAASAGVDALIAVGAGAGGHAGRISPYALIPWLKSAVNTPIIAAGCISTGQQMAASLALGAELCYMGTRFIPSDECGAQDEYKNMVVNASPEDIVYTNKVSGIHANFLKSTVPEDFQSESGPDKAKRWVDIWSAGQGVAQIEKRQSIEEIVQELVAGYHSTVAQLPR